MNTTSSAPAATPLASLHAERAADHLTSHPATRVECAHLNRGVLVIAAGGASISAGFDREWFAPQDGDGGLFDGDTLFSSSSSPSAVLADGGRGLSESVSMGGEKGMHYVHTAIEKLLAGREQGEGESGAVFDDVRSKLRTPPLSLSSGHVTCMAVRVLPGGNGALGVVGTTVGSLCVFVADGDTLATLREYTLREWSEGMVSVQDVIRSVGIGLDPAGRLEFIAVSTAHCAVVMDIQSLDDSRAHAHGTRAIAVLEQSQKKQGLATLKRSRSTTCVVPFVQGEVVRVLVPERYNAAFAFDVAVVLVLADGTLHFIERHVRGGSVRLLQDHHVRLQQANSATAYSVAYAAGETNGMTSWEQEAALQTDARALPHVVYAYQLSTFQFNVSKSVDGTRYHERGVTVNDAALSFNARTGRMDVVLVGSTYVSAAGSSDANNAREGGNGAAARPALSALARRALAAGLLPTNTIDHNRGTLLGQTSLATHPAAHSAEPQRLGWWAVARGVVLPQHSTHSILTKELRYAASASAETTSAEMLAATAADGGDAYVSLHTIHVQSSTLRLRRPRAPTSAFPVTDLRSTSAQLVTEQQQQGGSKAGTTMNGGSSSSSSGGGGADADAAHAGGAGCGGTVDGHRSELSTLLVVRPNDVALIASGTELYVASLSDAPVTTAMGAIREEGSSSSTLANSSTTLPALRHVRGGGTLWEDMACLSSAPPTAAAGGAKNAILTAGGSSVMLLTV